MEYLIVKFRESRTVIIDGHVQGKTNLVIELVGGQHIVSLGKPSNFNPPEYTVDIGNTSVVSPYELQFN